MHLNSILRGKTFVLVVIGALFIGLAFFDFSGAGASGPTCRLKIYGKCYRDQEVNRLTQFFVVARQLYWVEFSMALFGEDRLDGDPTDFVTNLIVLRKEAERLGIEPTLEEAKEAIRTAPIFMIQQGLTDDDLVNGVLAPRGLTKADLVQLGKDYLCWRKISDLLEAGNGTVPIEVEKAYVRDHQQFTASLVEFQREAFVDQVEITDEKIQNYFEENKGQQQPDGSMSLYSEEKRGLLTVKFSPPAETEEMTEEQKAEQRLSFNNRVNEIYANLANDESRFGELARKAAADPANAALKITVEEIPPFAASSPPEALKDASEALADIFSPARSTASGQSVTIPHPLPEGGYEIFQVTEIVEPAEMTLEEAREMIVEAIKARESNLLVNEAATAASAKMLEALEAGKSAADAAKAAGVELKPLDPFSRNQPPANVDAARQIVEVALQTKPGSVSEVLPMTLGKGYQFLVMDKVELVESEEQEDRMASLRIGANSEYRRALYKAWFQKRLKESGISHDGPVSPDALEIDASGAES